MTSASGIVRVLGGLRAYAEVSWHRTFEGETEAEVQLFWLKRNNSKGAPFSSRMLDRLEARDPYWQINVEEQITDIIAWEQHIMSTWDINTQHFHLHEAIDMMGLIPTFIQSDDPRPAKEQINEHYAHGGGWKPFKGFSRDPLTHAITFPGDPTLLPVAHTKLGAETIFIYPHAWVMILQPDLSFEIARLD